jgi:SAM-dependent methyltransferase
MADAYADAFDIFLASTDEKEVLAAELGQQIRRHGSRSLLDIGAGSGQLGGLLARLVEDYLAVEVRESYASQLRARGLRVQIARWPCPLDQRFDAVLMSHVLTFEDDLRVMIEPAVEALSPDGVLLLVLHDVNGSDWGQLLEMLEIPHLAETELPRRTTNFLRDEIGMKISVNYVTSFARTEYVSDMVDALRFVVAAGSKERLAPFDTKPTAIVRLLESRYQKSNGSFEFPFRHLVVTAGRNSREDAPHET